VEESRRNKSKRREKNREGVEMIDNIRKKKKRKYAESNERKKVFCLWRFWVYCLTL